MALSAQTLWSSELILYIFCSGVCSVRLINVPSKIGLKDNLSEILSRVSDLELPDSMLQMASGNTGLVIHIVDHSVLNFVITLAMTVVEQSSNY